MLIASGVPRKSLPAFWGALQIVAIVVNQIFLADSAIYLHISCRILRYFHNLLADFAIHSHIFIFFLRMSFIFRNFAAIFARSTIYKFVSARMTQLTKQ